MPGNQLIDNTYYIFDTSPSAVPSWPSGASIANIRLWTVGTNAALEFQITAGTPWLRFDYLTHGGFAAGSGGAVVERMFVLTFFGKRQSAAIIPTTLTAMSAWVEFV